MVGVLEWNVLQKSKQAIINVGGEPPTTCFSSYFYTWIGVSRSKGDLISKPMCLGLGWRKSDPVPRNLELCQIHCLWAHLIKATAFHSVLNVRTQKEPSRKFTVTAATIGPVEQTGMDLWAKDQSHTVQGTPAATSPPPNDHSESGNLRWGAVANRPSIILSSSIFFKK